MDDTQILNWLKNSLKIDHITTINQFKNGFQFFFILKALGCNVHKNNFINKFLFLIRNDDSCVLHNYKTATEQLESHFNLKINVQQAKGRPLQILQPVKQVKTFYQNYDRSHKKKQKQILNEKQLMNSLKNQIKEKTGFKVNLSVNQIQGMPKKIIDIQNKLQKFRGQKIRHEIDALKQRNNEIQLNNSIKQQMRQIELNKVRQNKQFVRQQQKRILQGWKKNENVKRQRMKRDSYYNKRQEDIKLDKINQRKMQEKNDFKTGLEYFSMNCIRQAIQLKHDPDRPKKKLDLQPFDNKTKLQLIRSNVERLEFQNKQRAKRRNRMAIEQQATQLASQKKSQQQQLLKALFNGIKQMNSCCKIQSRAKNLKKLHFEQRKEKAIQHQQKMMKAFQKNISQTAQLHKQNNELRNEQWRKMKLEYRQINLQRRVKKYQQHKQTSKVILNSLLDMVSTLHTYQQKNNSIQIQIPFWRTMCERFINNQPYQNRVYKTTKKPIKIQQKIQDQFTHYLKYQKKWEPISMQPIFEFDNIQLSKFLNKSIDILYPSIPNGQGINIPNGYLNLRIAIVGNEGVGKSVISKFLNQKYSLPHIDPKENIRELKAKQAQAQQQAKNKKAKDKKKVEQQIIRQPLKIPQQKQMVLTNVQQIANNLKKIGFKKVIEQDYKKLQQLNTKQDESAKKPGKKQAKKKEQKKQVDQQYVKLVNDRKYFYAHGYTVQNVSNWKQIQQAVTGMKKKKYRINNIAEQMKSKLSTLLPPYTNQQIKHPQSCFDIYIHVKTQKEDVLKRTNNRKLDPLTGKIYHQPLPNQKGLAQRLINLQEPVEHEFDRQHTEQLKGAKYVEISNSQSTIQMLRQVDKEIEQILLKKNDIYSDIMNGKDVQGIYCEQSRQEQAIKTQNKSVEEKVESQHQLHQEVQDKKQKKESINQTQILYLDIQEFSFLTQNIAQKTLQSWVIIQDTYIAEITEKTQELQKTRKIFIQQFQQLQQIFLQIVQKPNSFSFQLLKFQQNYNKLLQQKQGLIIIPHAKQHLNQKLDTLYDNIWNQIDKRKQQGRKERQNILKMGWIQGHMDKLVQLFLGFLQIQLNKITQAVQMLLNLQFMHIGQFNQSRQHILLDPFTQKQPQLILSQTQFPQIQWIVQYCRKEVQKINGIIEKGKNKFQKIKNKNKLYVNVEWIRQIIQIQLKSYNQRLINLKYFIISMIKQYAFMFQAFSLRMDDWIIYSTKADTDAIYDMVKKIKGFIKQGLESPVLHLNLNPISSSFHVLKALENSSILPLQLIANFSTSAIKQFLVQLRSVLIRNKIIDSGSRISFSIFKKYIQRKIKSNKIPQFLRTKKCYQPLLEFPYIQQCLLQQNKIKFQQIALVLILYRSNIPYADQVQQYYSQLQKNGRPDEFQSLSLESFIKTPSFFDQSQQDHQKNFNRTKAIKQLIFITFYNEYIDGLNTLQFINILRTFTMFQFQRFSQILGQDKMIFV